MSQLPITLYGDKILRRKSTDIKEVDLSTIELIKNMFETMRNAGGVGLAANQVGSDKSIFVVDLSNNEGYEDEKPRVFINPRIIERSEEENIIEEGCLSIPDLRFDIERPKAVKIVYRDTDLNEHTIDADEFLARVIQHEYDHLQGILFTDLISDQMRKKIKDELIKIKRRKIHVDYPVTENVDYELA